MPISGQTAFAKTVHMFAHMNGEQIAFVPIAVRLALTSGRMANALLVRQFALTLGKMAFALFVRSPAFTLGITASVQFVSLPALISGRMADAQHVGYIVSTNGQETFVTFVPTSVLTLNGKTVSVPIAAWFAHMKHMKTVLAHPVA